MMVYLIRILFIFTHFQVKNLNVGWNKFQNSFVDVFKLKVFIGYRSINQKIQPASIFHHVCRSKCFINQAVDEIWTHLSVQTFRLQRGIKLESLRAAEEKLTSHILDRKLWKWKPLFSVSHIFDVCFHAVELMQPLQMLTLLASQLQWRFHL